MTSTNLELMIKFPNNKRGQKYSPPKGFRDKHLLHEGMLMYIRREAPEDTPRYVYFPASVLLKATKDYKEVIFKVFVDDSINWDTCEIKIPHYNTKFIETLSKLAYKHSIGVLE